MKKYRINLWHGAMRTDLMNKLSAICNNTRNSEGDFVFEGTIDDFSEKWGLRFVVFPDINLIGVTQYTTFGAR